MRTLQRLSTGVAGLLTSFMPKMNKVHRQTSTRTMNYKHGGKPFTRGKRSKSLKIRSNRQKAKAKK